jgi:biopolymer transport protein ExbD
MLRKPRRSSNLISKIDTTVLTGVLVVVLLILLIVSWTYPTYHHAWSVDIPAILRPVAMRGALRDDAMQVTITRDGKIGFGPDLVASDELAGKIQDRLKDRGVERKIYIRADKRAKYGTVKAVLDAVRSAGIIRVAFLVDQRSVLQPD